MKITRTKSYKLNMGKYESMEISATVSVSDTDLFTEDELMDMGPGSNPDEMQEHLQKYAEGYLAKMLDPELKDAATLSSADDSMLFADPPAPPRRQRSTRRS